MPDDVLPPAYASALKTAVTDVSPTPGVKTQAGAVPPLPTVTVPESPPLQSTGASLWYS